MYPVIVRHKATVSTAITVIQLKAGAAVPFAITYLAVTQDGSINSAQEEIALVRKSAAATVTAGAVDTHVFKARANDPTPGLELGTTATGVIATAEGTDSATPYRQGFNVLNGLKEIWIPEDRIWVPGGGFIGLKFLVAPASHDWNFEIHILEARG